MNMPDTPRDIFHVSPQYQPLMRMLRLDAAGIFSDPRIVAWRKLPDRENCTLDADVDGKRVRLHIKRHFPTRGSSSPADAEVKGLQALRDAQIPTLTLVGWGMLPDRSSFVITADLEGHAAADKIISTADDFARLIDPTADLAAKLHSADLHHRDLYLCHFFAKVDADAVDLKLIDAARVSRLGGVFTRRRWIIKDLAQFWYSTMKLPITDEQRTRWLARYASQRRIAVERLRAAIERKVRWIANHDQKLNRAQPRRNISIPASDATIRS
jgi:hypothetical protein